MNALKNDKESFDNIISLVSKSKVDSNIITDNNNSSPDSKRSSIFQIDNSPTYRLHLETSLKSIIIRLINKLSKRKGY